MDDYPKFVGLGSLVLGRLWSNWFETENKKATPPPEDLSEASLQAKIDIQAGKRGLPAGSRFLLDLNPTFEPVITKREAAGPNFVPYPTWLFEEFMDGTLVRSATLGEGSYAVDGFVGFQSPENPSGHYQASLGYSPIVEYDGPSGGKAELRITASVSGFSIALTLPWCIQK